MGSDHIAPIGCLGIGIQHASIDVRPALNQSGDGPEFGDDEFKTIILERVIRELRLSSLTTPVARGHKPPGPNCPNLTYSGIPVHKQGIVKTIRDAVETYDTFTS